MNVFHKEIGILAALKYALSGLISAFKSQLNLRLHFFAISLVIMAAIYFQINYYEWLILISIIFNILVLELMNTSIEQTTDAITVEFNPIIKKAKDISAAAVLIYALYAVTIGLIIFGGKII